MQMPPPLPRPTSVPAAPVPEVERLGFPDVARGAAILGIFIVNMIGFKSPSMVTAMTGEPWLPGVANQVVLFLVDFLATGKFVALFTFLFGLGAALQFRRARDSGYGFTSFFAKRMAVLAVLGLAHGWLLWMGDILFCYALYGLFGLIFIARTPRTIAVWGAVFLLGPVVFELMGMLAIGAMGWDGHAYAGGWQRTGEWLVAAYGSGSAAEILQARMWEWRMLWAWSVWTEFPRLFGLFLLGLFVGRVGVRENLSRWRPRLRGLVRKTLPAGLLLSLFGTLILRKTDPFGTGPLWGLGYLAFLAGGLCLSFSYLILLDALAESRRFQKLAAVLAAVGRMALSHYLLQSVVANVLFVSIGFGLYGKVTAPAGLAIVAAVFFGQVWLSRVWLRHFFHGPCEWAWRALSYGRKPPWGRPGPQS